MEDNRHRVSMALIIPGPARGPCLSLVGFVESDANDRRAGPGMPTVIETDHEVGGRGSQ